MTPMALHMLGKVFTTELPSQLILYIKKKGKLFYLNIDIYVTLSDFNKSRFCLGWFIFYWFPNGIMNRCLVCLCMCAYVCRYRVSMGAHTLGHSQSGICRSVSYVFITLF